MLKPGHPEAEFQTLDASLEDWAQEHGVIWQRDYKGEAVRTFAYPVGQGRDTVQVWLHPPADGSVAISVAFNSAARTRRKIWSKGGDISSLRERLTQAKALALAWREGG